MSQQLVKKGANGRIEHINPKSWIEAIKDKNTGQTLVEILQGFNMYFLPYNGNTTSTRCLVPTMLRKKGLWITYVKYDGNVYTEWYAADEIDDKSWGDSSNWRIGNNTLVGDITISANGNWVINGTETEFKAVGEKGNTPLLRVANNRLQVSYDLGDTYRDVTSNPVYTKFKWLATTGDTQANNVGRIQASTDEGKTWTNMSNDFTNNLHIKKYIGVNESLPTSGIAEGTIYAKGPYYAEDDTLNDNPIYRLWVYAWKGNTLAWQDNGEFQSIAAGVVQETGDSETKVMSQKAVSEKLAELGSDLENSINANRYGYNVTVNGLNGGIHTIETAIKDVPSKFRMLGQKITFRTKNGDWATYHNESLSLDNYENVNDWVQEVGISSVQGDVNITNAPDYEDLTEAADSTIKFADKEYNKESFSGLGRVYLRKNIVDGKNVLTQDMMSKPNTIYIIQYDYDLQSAEITIPEGCILDFQGGSLSNGKIIGNNTELKSNTRIFYNITVLGTIRNYKIHLSWWHNGDTNEDCTDGLKNISSLCRFADGQRNHIIVLVNNDIKCQPNTFDVSDCSIDGCFCRIFSTNETERVGFGLKINGGYSQYTNTYVKDLSLYGYDIGVYHNGQYVQNNISCLYNNIGCKFEDGNTFLSYLYNCKYARNYKYGVHINNLRASLSNNGSILERVFLNRNGVAGLYISGAECRLNILNCDIENNGMRDDENFTGVGILIRTYHTFINIENCYFEVQGTPNGCSIVVCGELSELDEVLSELKETLIADGIEEVDPLEGALSINIKNNSHVETNGIFINHTRKYTCSIEGESIKPIEDNDKYFPIYFNTTNYEKEVNISNVFYTRYYNKGVAKSPIRLKNYDYTYEGRIQGTEFIKYNSQSITTSKTNYYTLFEYFGENDSINLIPESPIDSSEIKKISYRIFDDSNVRIFSKKVLKGNRDNNGVKLFLGNGNEPELSGKCLVLLGMKGEIINYRTSSTKSFIVDRDCFVFHFPPNVDDSYGIIVQSTPMLAILITEEQFKDKFNSYYIDAFASISYTSDYKELVLKGESETRPILTNDDIDKGFQYYDSTLNKPIWWTGTKWVDATGADV